MPSGNLGKDAGGRPAYHGWGWHPNADPATMESMSRSENMDSSEKVISLTQAAGELPSGITARLATGVLAFCCLCWGFSFPTMQFASTSLAKAMHTITQAALPTTLEFAVQGLFNSWRFALAAFVYWLLTWPRQRGYTAADWQAGITIGLFCGGGMFLQLTGLRYTLPSVSAFLTALAVVLAPLAQSLLFRKTVGMWTWLAVVIAVVGMLLMSQENPGAAAESLRTLIPPVPHLGEALTLLSSVLFTGYILAVGHFGQRVDAARMTAVMLTVVAIVNALGGLALGGRVAYTSAVLSTLVYDPVFIGSLVSLSLFSSVLAMHLMNRYQPFVSAATASVIYCLEPVFATLWSCGLRTEKLTSVTATGGAVILAASLIAAIAATKATKPPA
ncbi:MAG TPA: DMT family transporter [Tepidisphaeraceae bacterium]|nr:DMT family transporter [Tepidisphaeraceae bacterium]